MDSETLINFDEYFESPKVSSDTIFDGLFSCPDRIETKILYNSWFLFL